MIKSMRRGFSEGFPEDFAIGGVASETKSKQLSVGVKKYKIMIRKSFQSDLCLLKRQLRTTK